MKTKLRLFCAFALFLLTATGLAQINRGSMEGIVTDPQGGVVPAVEVTVTSLETNVSVPTKTNAAGYYRVVDLVPGRYRARFTATGFSVLDVTEIEVPAGQVIRVDTQLKLGATRERVQVTADVPLIETAPANFSTTLATRTIEEVPLAGRDLQQLVYLVPGVNNVGGPPSSNFGFNSQFGTFPDPTFTLGSTLAVNGGQAGANAWYLDGNLNLSSIAENIAVNPSPDAVAEFQVIANAFAAEYSRTGGAVFNVVLKSGTNALHGNIYEFTRQSATNARNPFTSIDSFGKIIKDRQLHYNNFGGTLGGPVILPKLYNGKNKTFFFFSWDTSILHLLGQQTFTVPTARMRQGDFSEDPLSAQAGIWDPSSTSGPDANGIVARSVFGTAKAGSPNGCTGYIDPGTKLAVNPSSGTCDFATAIPADRLDPTAMFFANSFPMPNFNSPLSGCPMGKDGFLICDNFQGPVGGSQVPHNISVKIDHEWSQKSKYFVEWLYNPATYRNFRVPWTGPAYPTSIGYGAKLPLDVRNQIYGLGNTYTFSPALINEFHYNFSRQFLTTVKGTKAYLEEFGALSDVEQRLAPLRIPTNAFYPTPSFNVSTPSGGGLNFGSPGWESINEMSEAHNLLDNVTKIIGRHTLKSGLAYRLEHSTWASDYPTFLGFYGGLTSDPTTGLGGGGGLGQFLLGAVDSNASSGFYHGPYERWRYWGAYVQDDFRITPRLSLNIGLRWDLYGWAKTRRKNEDKFCLSCLNPLTGLAGKLVYKGDPEFPGPDLYPANKNNFAPRFNFSWTPFADRKTIIRGGYDIFTSNAANGSNSPNQYQAPGWQYNTYWGGSFYKQCAPFSFQCVVFPLSDTTTDKATLATPPVTTTAPADARAPLLGVNMNFIAKPPRDPLVQMWSLEVEHELPGSTMLSVGYVGNHGTHLFGETFRSFDYVHTEDLLNYRTTIGANIPITDVYSGQTADLLAQVRGAGTDAQGNFVLPRSILLSAYPFYSGVTSTVYDGTSIYHGLNFKFQKKYSHGLNFIAAYTVSKKVTNASTIILAQALINPVADVRSGGIGGRAGAVGLRFNGDYYQDPDNRRDRIIAFDDIPQMLNIAASYELPFGIGKAFVNRKGILNGVLGGWKLAANFNAQSGVPLGIQGPCSELQKRTTYDCRPNLIGNPKFPSGRSKEQRIADWINSAAFEPPFGSDENFWANYDPSDARTWRFGTAGARLPGIRSPGFWNVDSALSKRFPITENKYFEFRWEMFNALNHQNLGLPNTYFCLPPNADGTFDGLVRYPGCTFGRITNIQTDPRSMEFAVKFFF